ncbi:trp operon leader peptide [Streptomyces sp. NPDC004609]
MYAHSTRYHWWWTAHPAAH